jgi:hypothetical protein
MHNHSRSVIEADCNGYPVEVRWLSGADLGVIGTALENLSGDLITSKHSNLVGAKLTARIATRSGWIFRDDAASGAFVRRFKESDPGVDWATGGTSQYQYTSFEQSSQPLEMTVPCRHLVAGHRRGKFSRGG